MTDKEWAFNEEEYSHEDGQPYLIVFTSINNHSPIIFDAVLLPNNSEYTFWWFPPTKNRFLRKIVKQRVSYWSGGMEPEGSKTLCAIIVSTVIDNHSPIIVYVALVTNISEYTFLCSILLPNKILHYKIDI